MSRPPPASEAPTDSRVALYMPDRTEAQILDHPTGIYARSEAEMEGGGFSSR